MEPNSELVKSLNGYFNWNKARMKCFVKMLLSLLSTRTVNLNKLACSMTGTAQQSSCYRRLQRFLAQMVINFDNVAGFIVSLFFTGKQQWYLTMDRTNWQWGKSDINILVLGIVYKGMALPIYWELLDKKGNSDTPERIEIVERFIKRFGKETMAGLLADREFVGKAWFGWLLRQRVGFYIRVKKNVLTTNAKGKVASIKELCYDMAIDERRNFGERKLWGYSLSLSVLKLADGELLAVASNGDDDAIKIYAKRWEIETLFGCLKGRGFYFEDTHIINQERIKKLMVLLAIAFCWAHKTGEFKHEENPIKLKTHGRMAVSLFRYGLDHLSNALANLVVSVKLFARCLKFIIPINPIPPYSGASL